MGWKRVKEHYQIGHIVHLDQGNLCIGSPFISQIIVISSDGKLLKPYKDSNDELARYQSEIMADIDLFKRLMQQPDEFTQSLPVYGFNDGVVFDALCEEYQWPNITHDGALMYDSRYFQHKEDAIRAAKQDMHAAIELISDTVAGITKDLARRTAELEHCKQALAKLDADYPETVVEARS